MFRSNQKDPTSSSSSELELVDGIASSTNDGDPSTDPLSLDEALAAKVPHFLDYDAQPPLDLEQQFDKVLNLNSSDTASGHAHESGGEHLKLDKRYERDGEISDFELAANGYTKKEFTQDDNTLHLTRMTNVTMQVLVNKKDSHNTKPKHFLDENPIPPDYMLLDHEREMREHRSLDRNFGRQHEQELQEPRTQSPISLRNERKSSLDSKNLHSSRERERMKQQQPSYALARFLESCADNPQSHSASGPSSLPLVYPKHVSRNSSPLPNQQVPKGAAWTADAFSFTSSSLHASSLKSPTSVSADENARLMADNLGPKVECVYSLLSMLGSNDPMEMAKKFLELSRSSGTCSALRRSGCIPLLVQMMYADTNSERVCKMASMALHNVVHSNPDEKAGRREAKVLRLLDQIIDYCNFLKTLLQSGGEAIADDSERHPLAAVSSLMKVSFDEEHRHAMCELGALQAIPNLVHLDHAVHGPKPDDQCCNSLRRYALMALTNLTFGDENNKALLCSQKLFMEALVSQLDAAPDDLLQVTASVLRNLSWRADNNMKAVLNEIGTVTALTRAAMKNRNENTLKAILSALWNLSAHCSTNKAEFCAVDGALAFLCKMLTYEGPSKTLKIIENAGGILRNVSSHIAVREHYRQILREHNCLSILLQQLKSESLTVVSNSCGTLWNLSARCPEDQKFLWDNGAVPMLRSLIHSKHAMISEGSSSALKNLLNFRPSLQNQNTLDPIARSMGLKKLPSLNVRKQKALEKELGAKKHTETCDNLDASASCVTTTSSKEHVMEKNFDALLQVHRRYPLVNSVGGAAAHHIPPTTTANAATKTLPNSRLTRSAMLTKSESRDSIFSTKSDMNSYEHAYLRSQSASDNNRNAMKAVNNAYTDNEPSDEVEQPIDYSVKYNESSSRHPQPLGETAGGLSESYQETDLDQPTDFSLRYAEHQIESDNDIKPAAASAATVKSSLAAKESVKITKSNVAIASNSNSGNANNNNNEIILVLDDSVKCYQTEDTPYVISNAASASDLRHMGRADNDESFKQPPDVKKTTKISNRQQIYVAQATNETPIVAYGPSGTFTPEKPVNYCEEGTPGYFSRYDSLSSLEESPSNAASTSNQAKNVKKPTENTNKCDDRKTVDPPGVQSHLATNVVVAPSTAPSTNMNSAQETPLMFSRYSSMDSLVEEDVGPIDDKSSVVSDFSRLASGVISPSEIPDSPTQSMPQSPRRNSEAPPINFDAQERDDGIIGLRSPSVSSTNKVADRQHFENNLEEKRPLRSVFEDNLNTFHVENTPAQFSSATSLSNLSILDDESIGAAENSQENRNDLTQERRHQQSIQNSRDKDERRANPFECEEDDDDGEIEIADSDDMLLANCINIGMNSVMKTNRKQRKSQLSKTSQSDAASHIGNTDEPRQYCTEDTPALLSKVGSNSNLSAISICSMENKENAFKITSDGTVEKTNRQSLNLSDDMSSNASDCGAAGNQSFDLLQQCIQEGMKTKTNIKSKPRIDAGAGKKQSYDGDFDPISMLRRGGNDLLPPYLPVTDEMSKYLVEDSPCNFSMMSDLSNLTVGSSLVGPATQLKSEGACAAAKIIDKNKNALPRALTPNMKSQPQSVNHSALQQAEEAQNENLHDDSLSSLSIESEDDTNLLSQAIAAGCNRPRSNLGFATVSGAGGVGKRSLSASQPIPINQLTAKPNNGNESYSSADSSDSNDNQSKSLLELCIMTGMKKGQQNSNNRSIALGRRGKHGGAVGGSSEPNSTTQSNPNLKQMDAVRNRVPSRHLATVSTLPVQSSHQHQDTDHHHQRERRRKDERLLMECIKTGISTKTNTGSGGDLHLVNTTTITVENLLIHNAGTHKEMPKNVQATSAAASETSYQTVGAVSSTAISTAHNMAASDVEQNKPHHISDAAINRNKEMNLFTKNSNNSNNNNNSSNISTGITDDHENRTQSAMMQMPSPVQKVDGNRQDLENESLTSPNDIGYNDDDASLATCSESQIAISKAASLDNTSNSSDGGGSNESFIIETGVSLLDQNASIDVIRSYDKHKDPDLMMKSVERLTLEFLTSAELLRSSSLNSSSSNNNVKMNETMEEPRQHRSDSISLSIGTTTTTNTCPNDVSFPSVSVSMPMVASMTSDGDEVDVGGDHDYDDDDDQATEADHKEFHDFAEITPTNEQQPLTSLIGFVNANIDVPEDIPNLYAGMDANITQPNSLETDTNTLIDDSALDFDHAASNSNSSSSGINFKLGGAVKAAVASMPGNALKKGFNIFDESQVNMTNSNIIAFEARALAENLYVDRASNSSLESRELDANDDCLTFSLNSLDLDNVRPPSGMESLNISGCYQDITPRAGSPQQMNISQQTKQHSNYGYMPQSPLSYGTSPKFPRKSLPSGLVARRALGQLVGQFVGSAESLNSSNLLDNIKPPSLMDELLDSMISVDSIQSELVDCESLATTISVTNYETAEADETLANNEFDDNTVTLHSCIDMLPHDANGHEFLDNEDGAGSGNSSNCTPIATEECYSSAESTPRKSLPASPHNGVKRTLTPKQKRKMSTDRFKTYTISGSEAGFNDDPTLSEEQKNLLAAASQDEVLQIEITETVNTKTKPKPAGSKSLRRRRSSQERYKTQTISYKTVCLDSTEERQSAYSSLTSTDDCGSEELSSIRAMTKKFPYLNENVSSVEGLEQNSDTESCNGDINDAKDITDNDFENDIASNPDVPICDAVTTTKATNDSNQNTKFEEVESNAGDAQVKAVRGRKKPAYISPYSIQYQRNCNNNQAKSSTSSATGALARLSPKVNTKAASTKVNESKIATTTSTKLTSKVQTNLRKVGSGDLKRPTIAENGATDVKPPTLERQGTFVKDEPSVMSSKVPVVPEEDSIEVENICPKTKSQESSPQRASKLPTKRPPVKANTTLSATSRGNRNVNKSLTTAKKDTSPGKALATKLPQIGKTQRSNSNAGIVARTNSNITDARIAALSTRVSVTTPPSRSNSSLNANLNANVGSKVQQAQSRIASIWKRVDDAKTKQKQPTMNVVGKPRSTTNLKSQETKSSTALNNGNISKTAAMNGVAADGGQTQKLVRSSTFDATPQHLINGKKPNSSLSNGGATGATVAKLSKPIRSNNFK